MANLDFFAARSDLKNVIDFVFAKTDIRMFESYSEFGQVEESKLLDDRDVRRGVARHAADYRRGIFCPAEFWAIISRRVTTQDAWRVLSELAPELQ